MLFSSGQHNFFFDLAILFHYFSWKAIHVRMKPHLVFWLLLSQPMREVPALFANVRPGWERERKRESEKAPELVEHGTWSYLGLVISSSIKIVVNLYIVCSLYVMCVDFKGRSINYHVKLHRCKKPYMTQTKKLYKTSFSCLLSKLTCSTNIAIKNFLQGLGIWFLLWSV